MPTSKNFDSSVACQKFVQSSLELPATDEIHMEDRKKVWPELSPKLIRPMAYAVRKAVINRQPSCAKTATFESRTNKMKTVSEEKHNAMTRINSVLYLPTVQIKKLKTGPASQYRCNKQHVHDKFSFYVPRKQMLAGRFKNISCNRNEPKPHKQMTNYRGVKLAEETCRLTAESKILYSTV